MPDNIIVPSEAPSTEATITPPAESVFTIPDQYKEKGWSKNVKSIDDLFNQFDNAQKLIGKKTPQKPDKLDDYELTEKERSDDQKKVLKEMFFNADLSKDQAKKLIEQYDKHEATILEAQQKAMQKMDEDFAVQMKERFGADWDVIAQKGKDFVEENLPDKKELLASMSNAQLGILAEIVHIYSKKIEDITGEDQTRPKSNAVTGTDIAALEKRASEIRSDKNYNDKNPFNPVKDQLIKELRQIYVDIDKAKNK